LTLARKALTISSWTLLSRILGLVRDRLWAGAMGGSVVLDAFLVAFAAPNMLRELFGEGALSQAFIPRYVQLRERDPAAAEVLAGAVMTRLLAVLSAVAVVGMAVAVAVVLSAAPGSKGFYVAALALPMVPYAIFICAAALLAGVLQSRNVFWVPAAAPVILNVAMISTIWLSPEAEAWILPQVVLVAGVLQALFPLAWLIRMRAQPPLTTAWPLEASELVRAVAPVLLASGVHQFNAFVGQVIALALVPGAGAVQFLYFAQRLLMFPAALIGHGVTTAVYPELSRRSGLGYASMGDGLREATRLQAFWLLPAAVGMAVVAEPLVRSIYQVGNFDAHAIARTVLCTQMFALALVPLSLTKLLVRAFHASRDQRTPMRVSLVMVAANLVLTLALVMTPLQEAGLALATAGSQTLGCVIYALTLRRRGAGQVVELARLGRPLLGALILAAGCSILLWYWPQPPGRGSMYAVLRLTAAVTLGMGLYLAVAGTGFLRRRRTSANA